MMKLLAAASCVALLAATGAKAQSPLGYDCRVPQIPGLVGAIVGLAQTQQRAACQQAAEQAQLRAAWEQQHQRDVAAAQQAAQQAAWAEQQRQAEARRQADIKQAEAQERARQVAQKAAEDAPDNACRSPDTARAMMKSLNDACQCRLKSPQKCRLRIPHFVAWSVCVDVYSACLFMWDVSPVQSPLEGQRPVAAPPCHEAPARHRGAAPWRCPTLR
jgi:Skp family chaperone for outer membrane proteins